MALASIKSTSLFARNMYKCTKGRAIRSCPGFNFLPKNTSTFWSRDRITNRHTNRQPTLLPKPQSPLTCVHICVIRARITENIFGKNSFYMQFMAHTAARQHGSFKMLWLFLWGTVLLSIFMISQRFRLKIFQQRYDRLSRSNTSSGQNLDCLLL